MNSAPANTPEPVLLIIADISGYTRYMTANAKLLAHSQTIITELIQAVVRQVELPLEIAKLEGDAVFLFCRKQGGSPAPAEIKRVIGERLLGFFRGFGEKLDQLSRSTTCRCNACARIETLRLKVVVHSGEALFHRVLNFVELAGVDVIIVHRLLKNSVNADQYLLLTEAARDDLKFPAGVSLAESAEAYDDIGRIHTLVYIPEFETPGGHERAGETSSQRFGQSWKLFSKLWFAPLFPRTGFRNLASGSSVWGRPAFALLTALLTPIFLPVGTIFVLFHALKPGGKSAPETRGREHAAGSSCCRKH